MSEDRFGKLADEIIVEIFQWIAPFSTRPKGGPIRNRDARSFSHCDRRLRRITLPFLYHTLYISTIKTLNGLLDTIIKFPAYSSLVKTLMLDGDQHDIFEASVVSDEGDKDLLNEAKMKALPGDLISYIEERRPWANALFLQLQLQDLEVLKVRTGLNSNYYMDLCFSEFLERKLLSPNLRVYIRESFEELYMDALFPIFLSPSINEVYIDLAVSKRGAKGGWYLPDGVEISSLYGTSIVETLELGTGGFSSDDFGKLLRLPRALKRLSYEAGPFTPWFDGPEFYKFREVLGVVSNSLTFLDIKWEHGSITSKHSSSFCSFSNFNYLRHLYITYGLLYGFDVSRAPCIAKSLPRNLETLVMYQAHNFYSWTKENYLDLCRGLLTKKSSGVLNHLKLIAHLFDLQLLRPLCDLANERNVKIAFKLDELDQRVVRSRFFFR
jgi:hypothetical protein